MEDMVSYTQAAVERAMKVQEVILRAMAKKITWRQAAEIIGISDRQMRRWRERALHCLAAPAPASHRRAVRSRRPVEWPTRRVGARGDRGACAQRAADLIQGDYSNYGVNECNRDFAPIETIA